MSESTTQRHPAIPLVLKCFCLCLMPLLAMKIMGMGYLPYDDALRHVAKAISGRPWSEILVLNPRFTMDHNFGWHVVLGFVQQVTGWQQDGLITFSVLSLFLIFALLPLLKLQRPEAWLAALLAALLAEQSIATRFFLGRPLVFSMAVLMLLCFLWMRSRKIEVRRPLLLGGSVLAIALAVWVHGAWYLFFLPVMALLLARWWRSAAQLAGCWLGGSLLGALFTGHPIGYLWQAVEIALQALGKHIPQRMLASEFFPTDGLFSFVVLIVLVIVARKAVTGQWPPLLDDPIFLLVALCWVLGLKVGRFWNDWGMPAVLVWMALNFQTMLEAGLPKDSYRNLGLGLFLGLAVYFNCINDTGSRWTLHLNSEFLDASKPEIKALMPDDGGIIYSPDMTIFYQTFYQNPKANWRYVLGFEPALMTQEDLNVFRTYQWNYGDTRALEPWIKKMRTEDRMILRGGNATVAPPELEWHEGVKGVWIGRLPRKSTQANPPAPVK